MMAPDGHHAHVVGDGWLKEATWRHLMATRGVPPGMFAPILRGLVDDVVDAMIFVLAEQDLIGIIDEDEQ